MRVPIRRILGLSAAAVIIWLVVSYSSVIEVPKIGQPRNINYLPDLELKIDNLQKQLHDQVQDTLKLLEILKNKNNDEPDDGDLYEDKLEEADGERRALVLPVLVVACNRVSVRRCLDGLLRHRPDKQTFPIVVSQDCGHEATYQVLKQYAAKDSSISVVRQPDLSDIPLPPAKAKFKGYYKIARHYKFALNHVFNDLGHDAVIIIEDDLDVSPDLFEYFLGAYPLLVQDPTLWCISAWNDNGKKELIDLTRPDLLHRTDFFPGLGWMLRKDSWRALEPKWPEAFFDDWLRDPRNVAGRACVRPEVSRTYSFGKVGVSKGMYFDVHLRHMHLNADPVRFTQLDLTYLIKERYDRNLSATLAALPRSSAELVAARPSGAVVVPYGDAAGFRRAARRLGLMDDFRSGVPRTGYRGVVSCAVGGRRVLLAPDFNWTRYDPAWG